MDHMRGYDDDRNTKVYIAIALVGGLIAGVFFNGMLAALFQSTPQVNVISIPDDVSAGKITTVKFITISDGIALKNANISLSGAAVGRGTTNANGMLELAVNATTNGSINIIGSRSGYRNGTSVIKSISGLDVTASPSSLTSGTDTFVTFNVMSLGKPVAGAALNISAAGISFEGITDASGQIIKQLNPNSTGKIAVIAKKEQNADGSAILTAIGQQVLAVSSSHNTLIVNVPVY